MPPRLKLLLIQWGIALFALWVVDGLFDSMRIDGLQPLLLAGLLLALANAFLKPLLLLVALPLAVLTLGLIIPVLNGLVLLLVAELVPGFSISGFWMGVLCAIVVSIASGLAEFAVGLKQARLMMGQPPAGPGSSGGGFDRRQPSRRGQNADPQDDSVIDVEPREKPDERRRD